MKEMKLKMESQRISIIDLETEKDEISKIFENIGKKQQTIILEVEKLKVLLHDSIQPHIKVQMRNQIEIWKAKDEKFVSTRAVDYVIKTIQKKSCITLTG
ncbi:unnamed protein product [Mytilus coruscus]|uniref:Uncharacterized protein n=1 Tax=Mytilus coruscus TaxID=42192 RepID=A0A6J7ZW55_MYTCO|nr:unnamed protein product [Mytilus coruscus]